MTDRKEIMKTKTSTKWAAVLAVCAVFCACDCFGKIGETVAEIQARYGKALNPGTFMGRPSWHHDFGDFIVMVVYDNSKSVMEGVIPKAEDRSLTDTETLAMIKAMTGSTNWTKLGYSDPIDTEWKSPDGFCARRHNSLVKTEHLVVMTQSFHDAIDTAAAKGTQDMAARFGGPATNNPAAAASSKKSGDDATFKFHKERAQSGNDISQYRLGMMYLEGKGCDVNTNEAKLWLQKAADQGNDDAKKALRDLP
jgi:TPR repeat protein